MERKGNHHDTQHKPGSGKPHFGSFGLCVGMDVGVLVGWLHRRGQREVMMLLGVLTLSLNG